MARKSARLSSGSRVNESAHKRAASDSTIPTGATAKRSRRADKSNSTPTKSKYFTGSDESEATGSEVEDGVEDSSEHDDGDASEFGHESEDSPLSEADDRDEFDSDDDRPKAPNKRGAKSIGTSKAQELWRPGVKTGLGPGTQVVIKKPKARAAGKTAYGDGTIHPNTMSFLEDLKANNDRQWLKMHDADFRQSERDWHSFVDMVTAKLTAIDETVPELPVKDVIFRIYRDIRFSPDPTPYKAHFSAAWSRTGRKGPYAHYYIQIAPHGGSFIGSGLWHPEAAPTAAMRREFHRRPSRIKAVLTENSLRKEFFEGTPKNEAKTVKAFFAKNAENALKTKPKGFDADHPEIDLLRLRNYTIGRKLEEAEVTSPDFLERVAHLLSCMEPYVTYLNSVVMPDEPEEDSSEESDNDDEAGSSEIAE